MKKPAVDQSLLDERIAALRTDESDEAIHALAELFMKRAATVKHPVVSATKAVLRNVKGRVRPDLYDRIYTAASEMAEGLSRERHAGPEWLPLSKVVEMFRSREDIMLRELRRYEFRRECGWPKFFLGSWWFPAAAFDARAPRYFAELPDTEPYSPPAGHETAPERSKEQRPTEPGFSEQRRMQRTPDSSQRIQQKPKS